MGWLAPHGDSELVDPFTAESRRVSGEQPWNWEARFSQDIKAWDGLR